MDSGVFGSITDNRCPTVFDATRDQTTTAMFSGGY